MSENAGSDDAFVNQAKDEPFGATPDESPQAGAPAPAVDDPQSGDVRSGDAQPVGSHGGDASGRTGQPSLAAPGRPDGEVDTRP